jgi:hypothetical protein
MTPPYSLEQAKYLQNLYKGFIGAEFEENRNVLVEEIAIVPFEQVSRQRFILYYMVVGKQAQAQVLQEYKGLLFDILLIARNERGELIHKDLCSYLASGSQPSFSLENADAGLLSDSAV